MSVIVVADTNPTTTKLRITAAREGNISRSANLDS
jgi:hypothetical protein